MDLEIETGIMHTNGQGLLEQLIIHPSEIFTYRQAKSIGFPSGTYALCLDVIRKQAAEADKRMKYKLVCGNIKKLFDYGGNTEVSCFIEELNAKYLRRSAMVEELDSLVTGLAKKK